MEKGSASVAVAHLHEAKRRGTYLPSALLAAQSVRPKLIDISGDGAVVRDTDVTDADPTKLLEEAIATALATTWHGNKEKVKLIISLHSRSRKWLLIYLRDLLLVGKSVASLRACSKSPLFAIRSSSNIFVLEI